MTGMRENVCIQGFVGEERYLEKLGIDGTKIFKLIFKKTGCGMEFNPYPANVENKVSS